MMPSLMHARYRSMISTQLRQMEAEAVAALQSAGFENRCHTSRPLVDLLEGDCVEAALAVIEFERRFPASRVNGEVKELLKVH